MTVADRLAAHAAWIARDCVGDGRMVEHGAVLTGAYLASADLRGANLRGANLRGATLRGAIMTGAKLRNTDLPFADLRNTDLRGADLTGADLTGADLTGANLRGAIMTGANLNVAIMAGADLHGALGLAYRSGCGRRARMIVAQRVDGAVMVTAGCRRDTPDTVVAAIERDYEDDPQMRDTYIRAVREIEAEVMAWPVDVDAACGRK